MSILYEALQKARHQREKEGFDLAGIQSPQIISQLKKFEEQQIKAIEKAIPKEALKFTWTGLTLVVLIPAVLFLAGILIFQKSTTPPILSDGGPSYLDDDQSFISRGSEIGRVISGKVRSSKVGRSEPLVLNEREVKIQKVPKDRLPPVPNRVMQPPAIIATRKVNAQKIKKGPSIPEFRCTGILGDRADRICFLNGLIARRGDVIDGARVLKIGTRGVLLDYNGIRLEVPLPEI